MNQVGRVDQIGRVDQTDQRTDQITNQITVTVKLFAIYQEAYGVPELVWQFPANAPVQAVLDRALAEHPRLEAWRSHPPRPKFAVCVRRYTPGPWRRGGADSPG